MLTPHGMGMCYLSRHHLACSGLAKHKEELGAPLCPCRHYEDKAAEVSLAYWNCPCVPMRERKECHCMLFLNPGTPFAGDKQAIPEELLVEPPKQGSI